MNKKISKILLPTFLILFSTTSVLAQDPIGTVQAPASIVTDPTQIYRLFSVIVNILVVVAGLWFFINILLGGVNYISGAGDPKKTGDAMKRITDSVVGLVIVAAAFIIANIASYLLLGPEFNLLAPTVKTITDFPQ